MARLLRSFRKTLTLNPQIHIQQQRLCISHPPIIISRRTYISEMRKEAFEGNISRLLRNEIQYEIQSSSSSKPPTNKFGSFMVDGRPGERWITLNRQFADENIKVEVTMFDGAAPAPKASGGVANSDEVQLHITLIVNIYKGDGGVLEIMCSAWPDSIEIKRLFVRAGKDTPAEPYAGPDFEELDDELQDGLYDFLDARGIDNKLATYLHQYMKHKDKTELIGWMVRSSSLGTHDKSRSTEFSHLKEKCSNFISRLSRHRRRHSADFHYDPLSYALNFEDDANGEKSVNNLKSFSARLPASPPSTPSPNSTNASVEIAARS